MELAMKHEYHNHTIPGGRIDRRGRVRIYLGRNHPFAQKSGQQWRSRYIAALCLGKMGGGKISRNFDIHHLDHDRSNDDPMNLVLIPHRTHSKLHCTKYEGEVFRVMHLGKMQYVDVVREGGKIVVKPLAGWYGKVAKNSYESVGRGLVSRWKESAPW